MYRQLPTANPPTANTNHFYRTVRSHIFIFIFCTDSTVVKDFPFKFHFKYSLSHFRSVSSLNLKMITSSSIVCDNDRSIFTDPSGAGFVEGKCLDSICSDCFVYSCFHNALLNNPCKMCSCKATKLEIFKHHNLSITDSQYGKKCVCGHSISHYPYSMC